MERCFANGITRQVPRLSKKVGVQIQGLIQGDTSIILHSNPSKWYGLERW